jgi:hypothetical protein
VKVNHRKWYLKYALDEHKCLKLDFMNPSLFILFFVYKKQMEFNVELSLYLFTACYKVMNQYKLIPCMNFVWLLLAPYLVSKAMHVPLAF